MVSTKKPQPPTPAALKQSLGARYTFLEQLLALDAVLRPEWKYYGAKLGWSLKLFEKKRNLCFIKADGAELRVGFVFGDKQYDDVMNAKLPVAIKHQLAGARRYAEGRGLSVIVDDAARLKVVVELIRLKRGPTA